MSNLTAVTLRDGVPIYGTGNVSTLDALMATIGTTADARSAATDATAITQMQVLKEISSCVQTLSAFVVALGQAAMAGSSPVVIASDQAGAGFDFVPHTIAAMTSATSGNCANADAVATFGGTTGKRSYLTGFTCTASGATTGKAVVVSVTGPVGAGTLNYIFTYPAGVLVPATPLDVVFDPPIETAVNGAIIVTLPAGGSGNTNACVSCTGFVQ